MTETPMMQCGHAANAVDSLGNPTCAICVGITPGARTVVESPDLTGATLFRANLTRAKGVIQ
jgi:hypothetical protein